MKLLTKKTWSNITVASSLLALAACGGSGGSDGSNVSSNEGTIKISGTLPAQTISFATKLLSIFMPSAYAFSITDVSKVIVFSRSGYYHTADVVNGSFSVDATLNEPVILVFAGVTNNYLGYYELPNGLGSIPLVSVKSGVSTIDLGSLSIASQVVTSSNNPLDQTDLDNNAKATITKTGQFFASMAKNIDADGNSIVDVLEKKYYRIQPLFFVDTQSFDQQGQLTGSAPSQLVNSYKIAFDFSENGSAEGISSVIFNGGGLSNAVSTQSNTYATRTTFFSPLISSNSFPQDNYTVGVGGKTLTFNLPAQSTLDDGVLLPVPSLTIDSNGLLTKISILSFTNKLGQTIANPKALISSNLQIQIDGSGTACGNYPQPGRMFNSSDLSKSTDFSVTPGCASLTMNKIDRIYFVYNDLFGNQYIVGHGVTH
jgi:hypothetical protein